MAIQPHATKGKGLRRVRLVVLRCGRADVEAELSCAIVAFFSEQPQLPVKRPYNLLLRFLGKGTLGALESFGGSSHRKASVIELSHRVLARLDSSRQSKRVQERSFGISLTRGTRKWAEDSPGGAVGRSKMLHLPKIVPLDSFVGPVRTAMKSFLDSDEAVLKSTRCNPSLRDCR